MGVAVGPSPARIFFSTKVFLRTALWLAPQLAVIGAFAAGEPAVTNVNNSGSNASNAEQVRFAVEKYTLPNGLTVLLHEDHTVPLISYQTWFRVGSKYEETGYTGIAHLFEHMMFKGAKRYTGEQFDTVLQLNGATNNAFTTQDYTGYYENLPSAKLELVMDIESDRMESLQINPEHLKSEREVVKEERRYRVDNNPTGILREALFGTSYRVSPYRWPVIGYMSDLDNITLEKANEFYRTYYAPNNAVLVIAGDFNSAAVKKLVNKYYGAIKSQPIPDRVRPAEPAQTAQRLQVVTRDVQNTTVAFAYHSPKSGTDEAYALDLLANILGKGTSSRLYKRLVYKDQVATSVSVFNLTLQDSGSFQIYISLKPGVDWNKVQRSVYGELWRPRHMKISADELEMAKNQTMKAFVDGLKTVHGKAESLAVNEVIFGDYEQLFKDLDRYNKVTVEQIRDVAKKYLAPEQSSLVVLKPSAPVTQKKSQQKKHAGEEP
jgi:zinc protease